MTQEALKLFGIVRRLFLLLGEKVRMRASQNPVSKLCGKQIPLRLGVFARVYVDFENER